MFEHSILQCAWPHGTPSATSVPRAQSSSLRLGFPPRCIAVLSGMIQPGTWKSGGPHWTCLVLLLRTGKLNSWQTCSGYTYGKKPRMQSTRVHATNTQPNMCVSDHTYTFKKLSICGTAKYEHRSVVLLNTNFRRMYCTWSRCSTFDRLEKADIAHRLRTSRDCEKPKNSKQSQ
jgi:hypothetical protein